MGPADDIISALNSGDAHIVLRAGVYNLASNMCSDGRLCLTSAHNGILIEAEVPGTVVLDAARSNRVLYITGTGVQLVGLNITGGYATDVSGRSRTHAFLKSISCLLERSGPFFYASYARFFDAYPAPR